MSITLLLLAQSCRKMHIASSPFNRYFGGFVPASLQPKQRCKGENKETEEARERKSKFKKWPTYPTSKLSKIVSSCIPCQCFVTRMQEPQWSGQSQLHLIYSKPTLQYIDYYILLPQLQSYIKPVYKVTTKHQGVLWCQYSMYPPYHIHTVITSSFACEQKSVRGAMQFMCD